MRFPIAAWLGAVLVTCLLASTPALPADRLVAFYVPWDTASRADLTAHLNKIGVFAPFWISLKTSDGVPTAAQDDDTYNAVAGAHPPPEIMPVVTNAHDAVWDGAVADAVVRNAESRATLTKALATLASEKHYSGYVFDFENLSPDTVAALPQFVDAVHSTFAPQNLKVWVTVPVDAVDWPTPALQKAGATVVLMAYDQCWVQSTPGPIAGDDWIAPALAASMKKLDASQTVIALANYAYDWPKGQAAKVLPVEQAKQIATDSNAAIARVAPQFNPAFTYTAQDNTAHVVWMLDGEDFVRQRALALRYRPQAIALWRLGLEDPALWDAPVKPAAAAPSKSTLPPPVCFQLPH